MLLLSLWNSGFLFREAELTNHSRRQFLLSPAWWILSLVSGCKVELCSTDFSVWRADLECHFRRWRYFAFRPHFLVCPLGGKGSNETRNKLPALFCKETPWVSWNCDSSYPQNNCMANQTGMSAICWNEATTLTYSQAKKQQLLTWQWISPCSLMIIMAIPRKTSEGVTTAQQLSVKTSC